MFCFAFLRVFKFLFSGYCLSYQFLLSFPCRLLFSTFFYFGYRISLCSSWLAAACCVDQVVRACKDPPVSEMKGLHHYGQPFQHLFKYMHSFVPLSVCLCERMYMCEWVCIPLLSLFTSSLNLGLPRTRACVSATLESCKTQ